MKIIFMGTPQIAVPTLKAVYDAGHEVALVVTRQDKPKGRGGEVTLSPIKEFALEKGFQIYQPDKLRGNQEAVDIFKKIAPDFFVVVAYGRILPQEVLDIPTIAPVNVHFSLLPKYRGAAPVNWAVVNGEKFSGVSTMLMDAGMDTGDILLMESVKINSKTAPELADELSLLGANLLIKTLSSYDTIKPIKQDESGVTLAPIIKKEDGLIDWSLAADMVENKVRGFYGWPSAYSHIDGKLMKINSVSVTDIKSANKSGEVVAIDKTSFTVGCADFGLKILNLQLEGKKAMDSVNFLSGYKLKLGDRIG